MIKLDQEQYMLIAINFGKKGHMGLDFSPMEPLDVSPIIGAIGSHWRKVQTHMTLLPKFHLAKMSRPFKLLFKLYFFIFTRKYFTPFINGNI